MKSSRRSSLPSCHLPSDRQLGEWTRFRSSVSINNTFQKQERKERGQPAMCLQIDNICLCWRIYFFVMETIIIILPSIIPTPALEQFFSSFNIVVEFHQNEKKNNVLYNISWKCPITVVKYSQWISWTSCR